MTNIFLISPRKAPEDRFTSHWHYLLENAPDLAQQIVESIVQRSGIPTSKLVEVIDHPSGFGRGNEPDFLIRCEDYEILCEHKLESDLGNEQLERYCRASKDRGNTYVILIANQAGIAIPEEARNSSVYRKRSASPTFGMMDGTVTLGSGRNAMAGVRRCG